MKVAIISQGFEERYLRLQPHRTLLEMGRQLLRWGHEVILVTDGAAAKLAAGAAAGPDRLPVRWVPHTHRQRPWRADVEPELAAAVHREAPDVVLWHISLSMMLWQSFRNTLAPHVVGVLTSPATSVEDVMQLGLRKASSNKRMIAAQLAGQLAASARLRQVVGAGRLDGLITLSEATRRYVIQQGVAPEKVQHVAPGVDAEWLQFEQGLKARDELRQAIGVKASDWLVTYFGSPAPIRGTRVLLEAVEQLGAVHPQIKLLLLFRRWQDEWGREVARLRQEVASGHLRGRVALVDGYLSQEHIMQRLACSDLVCLPFEILPSDAPLSVTETMALGQAVITTNIACMPELVPQGCGLLAPPHAVEPLAQGIESFMRTPELAHACGQRARQFVAKNRTWDRMGANLVAYLQQMQAGACHGSNHHQH